MNLDKLTVNVRPLQSFQAIDLGMMMARHWFIALWGLWWRRMLPLLVIILVFYGVRVAFGQSSSILGISWLWLWLLVWWLKPYAEIGMVIFLSQKLFDDKYDSKASWQQLKNLPLKAPLSLLTKYRLSMRRQLLIPILILEQQSQQQTAQRLRLLSQTQNNAITWHTIVFVMMEQLLYCGIAIFFIQLLPQNLLVDLPWQHWLFNPPMLVQLLSLMTYLLVVSVLSVFYISSGFSIYICKRSLLEGWDIELKFRKLANRYQVSQAAKISSNYQKIQEKLQSQPTQPPTAHEVVDEK